jgi:hypothetical protein
VRVHKVVYVIFQCHPRMGQFESISNWSVSASSQI